MSGARAYCLYQSTFEPFRLPPYQVVAYGPAGLTPAVPLLEDRDLVDDQPMHDRPGEICAHPARDAGR